MEREINVQEESLSSQLQERVAIDPANEASKAGHISVHGSDVTSQQAFQANHTNEDIDNSNADESIIVKEEVMLDDDDGNQRIRGDANFYMEYSYIIKLVIIQMMLCSAPAEMNRK